MITWQYLVCEFDRTDFYLMKASKYEPVGRKDLDELGEKGWELVNISGWQLDRAIALFKRPDPTASTKRT